MRWLKIGTWLGILWMLTGCVGTPKKVKPVEGFELERYKGKWYEIARLDHSFERGMTHVSAEYSSANDGGIRVKNRGYLQEKQLWKQVEGVAKFVGKEDVGHLKVSFFGPFYGSYVIGDLDRDGYQYALVCGPSLSYFWILSRTPVMEKAVKERLVEKAKGWGVDADQLIWVDQESVVGGGE